jgi:hypothetical protein
VRGDSERKRGEILRPMNRPLDDVKGGETKAGGCSLGALAVGGGAEVGKAVAERPQSKAHRARRLKSALRFWHWLGG